MRIVIFALQEIRPRGFFFEPSDYYVKNQVVEKIKKFQIIKSDGTVYFEDTFY